MEEYELQRQVTLQSHLDSILGMYCNGQKPLDYDDFDWWKNHINPISLSKDEYVPNMLDINNICKKIKVFSDVIEKEWIKMEKVKLISTVYDNNPENWENIYWESIGVTKYEWEKNFLKKKICVAPEIVNDKFQKITDNGFGCKPIVPFQDRLRGLLSHLYHIVQDFGIFFPLGYRNLTHVSEGDEFSMEKLYLRISSIDNDAKLNNFQKIREKRRAMIGWKADKKYKIFGKPFDFIQPNTEKFLSDVKRVLRMAILKNNKKFISTLIDKLNIVIKLRHIENSFCNVPKYTNKTWQEHDKVVYSLFNSVIEIVNDENRTREKKPNCEKLQFDFFNPSIIYK